MSHKERTRARILDEAAKAMRENGADGIGVAGLLNLHPEGDDPARPFEEPVSCEEHSLFLAHTPERDRPEQERERGERQPGNARGPARRVAD